MTGQLGMAPDSAVHYFLVNGEGRLVERGVLGRPDPVLSTHLDSITHISQIPELSSGTSHQLLERFPEREDHTIRIKGHELAMRIVSPENGDQSGGEVIMFLQNCQGGSRVVELKHSHRKISTFMNSIFDAALNPMFLADGKGRILAANERAVSMFGRPEKDITGTPLGVILAPGSRGELRQALVDVMARDADGSPEITFFCTGRTSDGDTFEAKAYVRSLDVEGESYVSMVLRDLSRREHQRRELRRSMRDRQELKTTLKHTISAVEDDKQDYRRKLFTRMQRDMFPLLDKMALEDDGDIRRELQGMIMDRLHAVFEGDDQVRDPYMLNLTPTEMEVCKYIQLGRGTKEIAEVMNLAFATIQTHRKNIRAKLGLKGKKTTLFAYLKGKVPE